MKLVIFDFDGVLVDTLSVCFSIISEVNENLSLEEYKSYFEGNINDAVKRGGTLKSFRPNYFDYYENRTRELKIPQELKKLLKELSSSYTLVIVSSTRTSTIKNILDREHASSYFTDIFGNEIHNSKVVKNKMLLKKYKILPENAVYVTDTTGDILEARECEIKSIAVTLGFHEEKRLQKENPEKIVSTPYELLKAIEEIL